MPLASNPIVISLASALLLAAAVTELSSRLWPDSQFALLVLCFIALCLNGWFNLRQAQARREAAGAGALGAAAAAGPATGAKEHQPRRERGGQRKERAAREERKPKSKDGPAHPNGKAAAPADGPREEGTVKWFQRSKGFGFVIRENGEEVFVHQRSIRGDGDRGRPVLKDGEKVSFVVTQRDRGPQAEDVVSLERRLR